MTDLLVQSGREVSAEAEERFLEMINQRAKRKPMAYIIGKQPFFGLEFEVTPEVLIPRADTETLVEFILSKQPARLLDLCTGSAVSYTHLDVYKRQYFSYIDAGQS